MGAILCKAPHLPTYRNFKGDDNLKVELISPMLYDRLHTLAMEYSVPVEVLVNLAVERLLNDVDFVRNLRTGKIEEI